MTVRLCSTLLFSALSLGSLLPLHAQQTADILVNPRQILGPVNRLVFGQNIGAADNAHIFSSDTTDENLIQRGDGFWDPIKDAPVPEVVLQSKAVGMSVLRYPGGCLAHNFDWRKAVGPDAKKAGWLFGVDEYLALCTAIGAMPLITVTDYALPVDQMPANAAGLVEYLNSLANAAHPWALKRKEWGHPEPYNVVWFELGNESMHGNHRVLPHRQFTAEQYAAYFNATAAAMRKVDPGIKIGLVLVPGAGLDVDSDWNHTVVRKAGASADFVIIHMYAPQMPNTGVPESVLMQAMMVAPQHIEERLVEYHQMIRRQLGRDLPLAVSEFNGGVDIPLRSPYRFSYGDALACADLIRVFLKPELNVALGNYWNFLNGAFGMLRTNEHSPDSAPETEEPALLLYKMWAQHFGSQLVKVEVQSPRAEFAGAGSEEASKDTVSKPRRQIEQVDLNQYSLVHAPLPPLPNVQIQQQSSDFTVVLRNLNRSIYPVLARIPRPETDPADPIEFTVSFDAKFIPEPGSDSTPLGIGLGDSRGWNATHSGIGIDDITTEWKHFDGTYMLTAQTSNVDLTARLMADGKNLSGRLLLHNLVVSEFISGHDAAYPLLTSSASVSTDGTKVYLMVFNKSSSDSIPATIHLTRFSGATARYWEIDGPSLQSSTGVTDTVRGEALSLTSQDTATHLFPAHSMTAIEFSSEP